MKIENKKILVTGGAGFIAYHLCNYLLENNNVLTILDNLSTGNINNINKLKKRYSFDFIEGDITNDEIINILINKKFDIIYNLACPANPDYCFSHPFDVMNTCFKGVLNVVTIAKKNNAKIIQFSTSEVYGDAKEIPQVETYNGNVNPLGIRACYEEGKRIAETILMESSKKYELNIKIIRIFNTYGPHMQLYDGRVIVSFIEKALKNEDIIIYGSGNQTRSFCFVSDLIEAIIKLTNYDNEKFFVINIGNPDEHSINELSVIIKNMIKSNSNIVHVPQKYDDHNRRKPDINKAKELLNWQPKVSLKAGIKKCIKYYKEILKDEEI